jgi:hypothetical protein
MARIDEVAGSLLIRGRMAVEARRILCPDPCRRVPSNELGREVRWMSMRMTALGGRL